MVSPSGNFMAMAKESRARESAGSISSFSPRLQSPSSERTKNTALRSASWITSMGPSAGRRWKLGRFGSMSRLEPFFTCPFRNRATTRLLLIGWGSPRRVHVGPAVRPTGWWFTVWNASSALAHAPRRDPLDHLSDLDRHGTEQLGLAGVQLGTPGGGAHGAHDGGRVPLLEEVDVAEGDLDVPV